MQLSNKQSEYVASDRSIGILILAAGGSSRLGTPKQLLTFQGETLLRRAVKSALQTTCQPVLVVTGANSEQIQPELSDLPVQVVLNDRWEEGMASSIGCGLKALLRHSPDISAGLIMLCDQPFLTCEILLELVRLYRETGPALAACTYAEEIGVPALFDRSLFPELFSLNGTQGAKRVIAGHVQNARFVAFPEGQFDIDTPSDYERLEAHPSHAS